MSRRPKTRKHRSFIAVALALMSLIATVSAARAHASLIASEPNDGTMVANAPRQMTLTFNEAVAPLVLRLVSPLGETRLLDNPAGRAERLVVPLPELTTGTHVLSWRVVSIDGHPVGGSVVFSVGAPSSGPPPATEAVSNPTVSAALWAAKLVVYLGLFVGIGGCFFAAWIATPGRPPAMATLAVALVFGMIALVISVGLQGADALELPLSGLGQKIAWETGLETSYGLTAICAAFVLFGGGFALQASTPNLARGLSLFALLGAGVALALSGHASAASPQWLMRPAVFCHAIGVAFWVGSLAPLAALLRDGSDRTAASLARFSRLIPWALVALIISGALLAVVQIEQPAAILTTLYGRVFLAKMAAVGVLLALAAWNRFRLTPRVSGGDRRAGATLAGSIRAEAIIVVMILALVATWRFSPPPRALAIELNRPAFVHLHTAKAMTDITITPGRAGPVSVAFVTRMSAPFASPVSTIVRRSFTPLAMLKVVGPGSCPSSIVTIISARFFIAGFAPLVSTKRSSSRFGSQPAERAMAKASP